MKYYICLFAFFLLFYIPYSWSQSSDTLQIDSSEVYPQGGLVDAARFVDGVAHTFVSPLHWKGKDWINVGGVVAGTALSTLLDKPVRSLMQDQEGKVWNGIERVGYHGGKPYAAFIMTGGFYLTGVIFKNKWAKETGLILGAAYLTSGALQTFMKTAVGRARPGTEVGPWAFDPFSESPAYHSFPSGHIQIAMVSALVLGHRVHNPWLKGLFYAAGATTFIGRLHTDAHWMSDMVFGTAISYFCTRAVINRMDSNHQNHIFSKKKNPIAWQLSPSWQGVSLRGTF